MKDSASGRCPAARLRRPCLPTEGRDSDSDFGARLTEDMRQSLSRRLRRYPWYCCLGCMATLSHLTWCLWLWMTKPLFAVHENVSGFQPAVLVTLLGDLYELVSVDATPSDAGFHSVKRPRIYSILYLKGRVSQRCSITSRVGFPPDSCPIFHRVPYRHRRTEEELDAVAQQLSRQGALHVPED